MSTPSYAIRPARQLVLSLCKTESCEVSKVLDSPAHGVDIAFSEGFEFAGCVNITHRAPNQFSYRYGRKVAPFDWTI
jgi:hypothetical protein